ncbi:MAG TPA: VOC family protein [Candidatus Baltobacteraceae bacterium]|jgi:catechol 2,3-dioxygenase-like lactoylglutathione lyase family enzyme|nr:VOC family protein [Candidatus Baltobacteraceae bacterium]
MSAFLGFDHLDCRVRTLAAVESFYDELLPQIGLTDKRYAKVDANGEWHTVADAYNAVEYCEPANGERPRHFIGFIEDPLHRFNETRIAFRVAVAPLETLAAMVRRAGGANIELSDDPSYPAVFFEDPAGTKLELISRPA